MPIGVAYCDGTQGFTAQPTAGESNVARAGYRSHLRRMVVAWIRRLRVEQEMKLALQYLDEKSLRELGLTRAQYDRASRAFRIE